MSVEDYMKQNGFYPIYKEMQKIRAKENEKTKTETISEIADGAGSGSGTPSERPEDAITDDDIDNMFND